MGNIEYQYESAQKFCVEGIRYLIESEQDAEKILFSVVFLQTSVELLTKHYHIQKLGSEKSNNQINKILRLSFNELKKEILEEINSEGFTEDLLGYFQALRNKIMHQGFSDSSYDHSEATVLSCALLIHGISSLVEPKNGFMSSVEKIDTVKAFIGRQYSDLIKMKPYVEKIKGIVYDHDCVSVCVMCSEETTVIENNSYFCYLCGFGQDHMFSDYTKCYNCEEEFGLLFDKLNTGSLGEFYGKCLYCNLPEEIITCGTCGDLYPFLSDPDSFRDDLKKSFQITKVATCPKCVRK